MEERKRGGWESPCEYLSHGSAFHCGKCYSDCWYPQHDSQRSWKTVSIFPTNRAWSPYLDRPGDTRHATHVGPTDAHCVPIGTFLSFVGRTNSCRLLETAADQRYSVAKRRYQRLVWGNIWDCGCEHVWERRMASRSDSSTYGSESLLGMRVSSLKSVSTMDVESGKMCYEVSLLYDGWLALLKG